MLKTRKAEEMAIKWVTENIFGNHLKIMESYCEPEPDEGPYDMNWHNPLGSCGQSVSKHPVTKKIQFKKAITYTRGSFKTRVQTHNCYILILLSFTLLQKF